MRGFTRVLNEQLEDKAKMKVQGTDEIVQWMIRWAAMLTSRYLVGKDGKTGYERRRGRRCNIPVVPFGEKVWYREIRKTKHRDNKLETELKEGVWLGHARNANEVFVGTKRGVVRAYDVRRREPAERCDAEAIQTMRGTPQQPDPAKAGIHVPIRVSFDEAATVVEEPAVPMRKGLGMRRFRIAPKVLNKYGYTDKCEGW